VLTFQTRDPGHYIWSTISRKIMKDEIKTRISIIQKEKLSIKRIRFKIEIQNKSYIWLNGEIENKSKFSEMTKKDKKNEDQN